MRSGGGSISLRRDSYRGVNDIIVWTVSRKKYSKPRISRVVSKPDSNHGSANTANRTLTAK